MNLAPFSVDDSSSKLSVGFGLLHNYENYEAQQYQSSNYRQNLNLHVTPVEHPLQIGRVLLEFTSEAYIAYDSTFHPRCPIVQILQAFFVHYQLFDAFTQLAL